MDADDRIFSLLRTVTAMACVVLVVLFVVQAEMKYFWWAVLAFCLNQVNWS